MSAVEWQVNNYLNNIYKFTFKWYCLMILFQLYNLFRISMRRRSSNPQTPHPIWKEIWSLQEFSLTSNPHVIDWSLALELSFQVFCTWLSEVSWFASPTFSGLGCKSHFRVYGSIFRKFISKAIWNLFPSLPGSRLLSRFMLCWVLLLVWTIYELKGLEIQFHVACQNLNTNTLQHCTNVWLKNFMLIIHPEA